MRDTHALTADAISLNQPDRRKVDQSLLRCNRAVSTGDSYGNLCKPTIVNVANSSPDTSWVDAANVLLRQRLNVVGRFGHSGYRTDQILDDAGTNWIASEVAPLVPLGVVLCSVNINDIVQGYAASVIAANTRTIVNQINDLGALAVWFTPAPTRSMDTIAEATNYCELGIRLREFARDNPGFVLVDDASRLIYGSYFDNNIAQIFERTPTSASPYNSPVDVHTDGTHLGSYGAALRASELADVLAPLFPAVPLTTSYQYDPGNLLAGNCGLQLGTAGVHANGNSTGNVATGWQVTAGAATVTASKVNRTDMPGSWQQIAVNAASVTSALYQPRVDTTTGFTAGNGSQYYGVAEFEMDDDHVNLQEHNMLVQGRNVANGTTFQAWSMWHTGSNLSLRRPAGRYRTYPFTVPAGTTKLQMICRILTQAGTTRWGRCEIRKVLA